MGKSALRQTLVAATQNRLLARILVAYLITVLAEYGQWIAVLVYAYDRGGTGAAALVAVVQLVPSVIVAPLIGAHFARRGVPRLVAIGNLVGAAALIGCGAAIMSGAPVAAVYLLAVLFTIAISVSRAQHNVLVTLVVRHPQELTAANVCSGWSEGIGTLVGPLLAGILLNLRGPGMACVVIGAIYIVAAPLVYVSPRRSADADAAVVEDEEGGLGTLVAAARAIGTHPTTRALATFPAASAAVQGAIDLLVVILAVQILAIGQGGAGFLSAAFGLGGLLGALASVALVGRRLALPLAGSAVACGGALAALVLVSTTWAAVALVVAVGLTLAVQTVAATTLLQRSTPLDVIACVFALIESTRDVGMTLGALAVPLLVGVGGNDAAFLGVAAICPLTVLLLAGRVRDVDEHASIPIVQMGALRAVPIFAALPGTPLETLAREAEYLQVDAGREVIRQGDDGDAFYAISDGEVSVAHDGIELRRMTRGDGFGEIALLHAVPRTATVTTTAPTTLLRIGSEPFMIALGANTAVAAAAERAARRHLGVGG